LPEVNRRGPRLYRRVPELPQLDLDAVRRHLDAGAALVDARSIDDFARAHPAGAISIRDRPVFGTWLGWLVPLDRPVVFVLDDEVDRVELVRRCLTVGHDAIAGELAGGLRSWTDAGLPTGEITLDRTPTPGTLVLDVRQDAEWEAGHVPGAVHVELAALTQPLDTELPVTVMCGHGERAMTGASLLERLGQQRLRVFAGGPERWVQALGAELVGGP
jgi:rhodanese-related sulfurtransferase